MHQVGEVIVRIAAQKRHHGCPPTGRKAQAELLQSAVGLVAGIPQGHDHAGKEGDDHRGHDPFVIDPITDMGGDPGDAPTMEQKGISGLKQGEPPVPGPALGKLRFQPVEQIAKKLHEYRTLTLTYCFCEVSTKILNTGNTIAIGPAQWR